MLSSTKIAIVKFPGWQAATELAYDRIEPVDAHIRAWLTPDKCKRSLRRKTLHFAGAASGAFQSKGSSASG